MSPLRALLESKFPPATEEHLINTASIEKFIERLGKTYNIRNRDRWNTTQNGTNTEERGFTMVPFSQNSGICRHRKSCSTLDEEHHPKGNIHPQSWIANSNIVMQQRSGENTQADKNRRKSIGKL